MPKGAARFASLSCVCLAAAVCGLARPAAATEVRYLYSLSDFSGAVPYDDVILHVDRDRDEVYATTGRTVRVFNAAGMESFRFGDDWNLGMIYGLAVESEGDILLLAHQMLSDREQRWDIVRCDYRGEPLERLEIELPSELRSFSPDRLLYGDGLLHLVSTNELRAVVLDRSGRLVRSWDLAELLAIEDPATQQIFGTGLDSRGNLLLTIPVLFQAFIVPPDGQVRRFGGPGSAPGLFGIASGIAADDHGNVFVADRLRNVVMMFDRSLDFVLEFGLEPDSLALVRPTELTVGNDGRLYVTQARKEGVAVFALRTAGAALAAESEPLQKGGDQGTERPADSATDRESPRASSRGLPAEQHALIREEESQ